MTPGMLAAISAAAEASPMVSEGVPEMVPGRHLLIDGDFMAYYCAGNDGTSPGMARRNVMERVALMKMLSGSEHVVMHLTHSASNKGNRYVAATVKPYQGQRKDGRKPRNWRFLRDFLSTYVGPAFTVKIWTAREADDGIAYHSAVLGPDFAVIATKDKDMRMIPAWHIVWDSCKMVPPTLGFSSEHDDLVYGHKWFWLQMLQGDTADNIPGLPKFVVNGKEKLCGEKTARDLLSSVGGDDEAFRVVFDLYESYYADEAADRFVEQASLLWLRNDISASPVNFAGCLRINDNRVAAACTRLQQRIADANREAESLGHSPGAEGVPATPAAG